MFSLFLRPISPRDVQLYALRDEIEHSKRFYLSPSPVSLKQHLPIGIEFSEIRKSTDRQSMLSFVIPRKTKRNKAERAKWIFHIANKNDKITEPSRDGGLNKKTRARRADSILPAVFIGGNV